MSEWKQRFIGVLSHSRIHRLTRVVAFVVICLARLDCAMAQESSKAPDSNKQWPQFLGPDRTGKSTETGLVDGFGENGPRELWRQPMVGGLSGIAIADGQLLTLAQSEGNQWLVALDAETGKLKWRTPLAPAYENAMGDGPRATPTIESGVAFGYTGEGILTAVDVANGKVAWSVNLPSELKCKPSEYGMSCSPLVHQSAVIAHVGSDAGAVVGVDKKTGKVLWQAGKGAAGYSSPVLMTLAEVKQVVAFVGNQVIGLEPEKGSVLWSFPFETEYNCNTACPVAVNDGVLISSGENHGSVLLKVTATNNLWQVAPVWESLGSASSLRSEWQTPVLLDGCLYGFDNVGSAGPVAHLACVEAATGKPLWKKLRFGKGNLIAADSKLIISTIDGDVVLVKASKESYQELGRKTIVGFTRQAPVLCNGKLYMRDEAEIVCLDFVKQ